MTRKAVLIAASIALALGSSAAFAAGKKHGSPAGTPMDPRVEFQSKAKGGWQNWCALNSSCNGWDKYMQGVAAHRKFTPGTMVIPSM